MKLTVAWGSSASRSTIAARDLIVPRKSLRTRDEGPTLCVRSLYGRNGLTRSLLRFDSIAVWCGVEGFFMSAKLSSKDVRKRINHPVIDADGHWLKFGPSITDY